VTAGSWPNRLAVADLPDIWRHTNILAASLTREGVVAVIADVSAPMTSDQWARAAVDLAVDDGASEIAVEGFAARETYQHVVKDASAGPSLIGPSASPPGHRKARAGAALLQGLETGTTADRRHLPDLEGRRDHRPLPRTGSGQPGCGRQIDA
jgi:phage terminase large subunit-like protein